VRLSVGVIGGGQLGRMLGLAAVPLGIDIEFLDHSTDVPAAAVGLVTVGWPGEGDSLQEWASDVDVITYELEGVPSGPLREVQLLGADIAPPVAALEVTQDRWAEKQAFAAAGIPAATSRLVASEAELLAAVTELGDVVVKTRTGGYDGKGQAVVRGPADREGILSATVLLLDGSDLVVEERIPFDAEVSIIGARTAAGRTAIYPLTRNEHTDGILRVSRVPAAVPPEVEATAREYLNRLLTELDYVGVLAVELFLVADRLVANEMAPRVHNSGHWTIDAADTSQFEQHLRAVCGLPLGSAAARGPAAMVNLIGTVPDSAELLVIPGTHLHLYDKEPRAARKLGHVTVTAPDEASLEERLAAVLAVVGIDAPDAVP
jgi:5-(carboxyamino)imidazole ribonucleotide synthase